MSEKKVSQNNKFQNNKGDVKSCIPDIDRRRIVSRLAKASVTVPVATILFDASNNAAHGS